MKAVNLIPAESKPRTIGGSRASLGASHAILGLLTVAVAFVTIYVLTSNTVADRKAQVAVLQSEVTQAHVQAARLGSYVTFEQLAQARAATVRQITASRFDWESALSDLSKVVPSNTSLQSLLGTVAPGATVSGPGGSSGGNTGGLRSAINAPAFELKGCTRTQDDVARLMSRLRVINGVTRVTLSDSQKAAGASTGASVSASSAGATTGCPANGPTFDLVVFFSALPGAGPAGVQPVATTPPGAPGSSAPATSTPPVSTATPSAATPASTASTTPSTTTTQTPASAPGTTTSPTPVSTGGGR
ncbi:MAG: PilN domain-containing protein [Solirubrobacteraceae bacterium]